MDPELISLESIMISDAADPSGGISTPLEQLSIVAPCITAVQPPDWRRAVVHLLKEISLKRTC